MVLEQVLQLQDKREKKKKKKYGLKMFDRNESIFHKNLRIKQ